MKYHNKLYRLKGIAMKFIIMATTFIISSVLAVGTLHAQEETVFYSNIYPSVLGSPTYIHLGVTELADDIPFTGSHVVSSFTVGYKFSYLPTPFRAIFRFYGVDPVNGYPGFLKAEIIRDLPADAQATTTIQLDADEQFVFDSEPNMYPPEYPGNVCCSSAGGWFSVQIEPLDSSDVLTGLFWRMARGTSFPAMYNIDYGRIVSTFDPDGFIDASFYLELLSTDSSFAETDLSITMQDSPDPVSKSELLTYNINVTNNGPDDATGVTLTDTLPNDITFESVTTSQGSCAPITKIKGKGKKTTIETTGVDCTLGSLINGATASVDIVLRPNSAGTSTNSASVSAAEDDSDLTNNSASEATTVEDTGRVKPCKGKKCQ